MTLKDIAKEAGVSVSTVSRVINNKGANAASLFARTPSAPNNPFFSTIAKSVETEAYKYNYFLKSSFTSFNINDIDSYKMLQASTNGIVILGRCDQTTLKYIKKYCHHVIFTGLNPLDAKYDQVICDGYSATTMAIFWPAGKPPNISISWGTAISAM